MPSSAEKTTRSSTTPSVATADQGALGSPNPARSSPVADGGRAHADLVVRLFGGVQATWRSHEVALEGRPTSALMALLVFRRRAWTREEIAAEIWPEAAYGSSGRVRQVLWLLRKGLASAGADPGAVLDVNDETIALRSSVTADVDVARFEDLVRRRPPDVEAAIRLYDGDIAEGLGLECLSVRREYLASLYENALAGAARARLTAGDVDGARWAAVQLLERDPIREDAHSVLMEAYGLLGLRSQVHRQYRSLCQLLATELGAAPLAETDATYADVLAGVTRRSVARTTRRHVEPSAMDLGV